MNIFSRTIFVVSLACSISATCMETPDALIQTYIGRPRYIMKEIYRFSWRDLREFHDEQYNNLLHITVKALDQNKDSSQYPKIFEDCKPLLQYLADCGVDVNECNDDRETPVGISFSSPMRSENSSLVEDYFKKELGARLAWISFCT